MLFNGICVIVSHTKLAKVRYDYGYQHWPNQLIVVTLVLLL